METSILLSTKNKLNLADDYTVFDASIIDYINSTFSILTQIGIGPTNGFAIEDGTAEWADFTQDDLVYNMVRSYVFLKVRMLFDPPTTSFHLDAMNKQITEYEQRMSLHREWMLDPVDPMP